MHHRQNSLATGRVPSLSLSLSLQCSECYADLKYSVLLKCRLAPPCTYLLSTSHGRMSDELAQGNTMHTRKFFASYISIAFGFSVQKVFSTFNSLAGSVYYLESFLLNHIGAKNGTKTTTKKPNPQSISWGSSEYGYLSKYIQGLNDAQRHWEIIVY